jgi:hypothetical protein
LMTTNISMGASHFLLSFHKIRSPEARCNEGCIIEIAFLSRNFKKWDAPLRWMVLRLSKELKTVEKQHRKAQVPSSSERYLSSCKAYLCPQVDNSEQIIVTRCFRKILLVDSRGGDARSQDFNH